MARAFTISTIGRARELFSGCDIASVTARADIASPFQRVNAVWDTGATNSVVSEQVVAALELKAIDNVVAHDANATHHREVFLVSLMLPGGIVFPRQRVTGHKLQPGYDVLIGMDIIGAGDFAVTNKDGNTVFSFRHPSTERIDFAAQQPT